MGIQYYVWWASRHDGIVGYFKTPDIPPEFKHPERIDISDVMDSMRLTDVDRCLEIMNQHWKEPVLGPRSPESFRN